MGNKINKLRKKSPRLSKQRTGKQNYKKRLKKQPPPVMNTPLIELQPVNINTPPIDARDLDAWNRSPEALVISEPVQFQPSHIETEILPPDVRLQDVPASSTSAGKLVADSKPTVKRLTRNEKGLFQREIKTHNHKHKPRDKKGLLPRKIKTDDQRDAYNRAPLPIQYQPSTIKIQISAPNVGLQDPASSLSVGELVADSEPTVKIEQCDEWLIVEVDSDEDLNIDPLGI